MSEQEAELDSAKDSAAFYLGLAALIVAVGAHALVWSGGLLALPLAWLLALVAVVVAIRRLASLNARSRWGLAMALLVLCGSLLEFGVFAIRRAME